RTYPAAWLRRHGLAAMFERVMVNEGGLRSPHYKLAALDLLGAAEHIDDDPRTAQLLAQRSRTRIFLRTWPTNRDVELDPRVERVNDVHELADRLGARRCSPRRRSARLARPPPVTLDPCKASRRRPSSA